MLDAVVAIWNFLASMWRALPESTKNDVKEKMVDAMEDKFRRYYADAKAKAKEAA